MGVSEPFQVSELLFPDIDFLPFAIKEESDKEAEGKVKQTAANSGVEGPAVPAESSAKKAAASPKEVW